VVQVNTLRTTAEGLKETLGNAGVTAVDHPWMADCLILSHVGNLEQLPAFQNGLFYVQDAAAKLSVLCAQLPKGDDVQILDCCSAPGGKSFAAAIAMEGKGHIHSCDIHSHKTACLIDSGFVIGAVLAGAPEEDIQRLHRIAHDTGVAFQIQDDILDVTGDSAELGKPVGSDEEEGKVTYVTLYGLEKASADVLALSERALEEFDSLSAGDGFLRQLILKLVSRRK
jgi:hypothetical protein